MTQTGFSDSAAFMSPRTAKYVEAMVREGFDYGKWLENVRQEGAKAKLAEVTGSSGELGPAPIHKPMRTPDEQHGRPKPTWQLKISLPSLRSLRRRQVESKTPNARIRRWLEKVHCASGEFQGSRKRDGVYEYLAAVFAIVMHYKIRGRTTRLLRHAFKFANLSFDRKRRPL